MSFTPTIAVVVPFFDRPRELQSLLSCLVKQTFQDFSTTIVSHGPNDVRPPVPPELDVHWVRGTPKEWWSKTINRGLDDTKHRFSRPPYILLMNDDVEFGEDYLETLVVEARRNPHALIGSALKRSFETNWAGGTLLIDYSDCSFAQVQGSKHGQCSTRSDALSGRGMLIPVAAIEQLGLIRANLFPHYMADYDYSVLANEAGFDLRVALDAVVVSPPADQDAYRRGRLRAWLNRGSTSNARDRILFFLLHGPLSLRLSAPIRVPWRAFWRRRASSASAAPPT